MNRSPSENGIGYQNVQNGPEGFDRKLSQGDCVASNSVPKTRQKILRWNGWGYKDSGFVVKNDEQDEKQFQFIGGRYLEGEGDIVDLPFFMDYFRTAVGLNPNDPAQSLKSVPEPNKQEDYPVSKVKASEGHPSLLSRLDKEGISYSLKGQDRLFRSHGHTLEDIYNLKVGKWGRIPDIVVWPESHDQVMEVVHLAKEYNIVVIPFGGGTSVTEALKCSEEEERIILSLDTSQMTRILWTDPENLSCCVESGITGKDLETRLKAKGYTMGHEPDSYEFSTLGGWVATRASGMKKNTYGNIEDILVHVKMVTPSGVIEKYCQQSPRISAGPDIHHFVLGSEGTLGVVTEVIVKIRPLPSCKRYGSIVFPEFSNGVACLREVAKQRCQPSSIRLIDNEQFKFGYALRPQPTSLGSIMDAIKSFYLTKWKGFDHDHMCIATLLFEGDEEDIKNQEAKIYAIASKFGGMAAGGTNGERGYNLTFVIAYIRDALLEFNGYGESFETSVPWKNTYKLCENVKLKLKHEAKVRGISDLYISCRVTQTYDTGSCVYFYLGINGKGLQDPMKMYMELEDIAREEILANGGSISHHHGVGKIRKKFIPQTISKSAIHVLATLKKALDPENIFASGNILPKTDTDAQDGIF